MESSDRTRSLRRWLITVGILFCLSLAGTCYGILSTFLAPQRFEGFTTVMPTAVAHQQLDPKQTLTDMAEMVASPKVIARTAERLHEAGVKTAPGEIKQALTVTPVHDTTLLTIRIVSENSTKALATVDLLTKEFIKSYNESNRTRFVRPSDVRAGKDDRGRLIDAHKNNPDEAAIIAKEINTIGLVQLVDTPQVRPVNSHKKLKVLPGVFVLLVCAAAFFILLVLYLISLHNDGVKALQS